MSNEIFDVYISVRPTGFSGIWGDSVLPVCIERREFFKKGFKIHEVETIMFINTEPKLWGSAEHGLKLNIISVRVHLTCTWRRPTSFSVSETTTVHWGLADSSHAGIGPPGVPILASAFLLPCPDLLLSYSSSLLQQPSTDTENEVY